MQLESKIAQLFVVPAPHPELERFVRDVGVGGVIWFAARSGEAAAMNARLQELAATPLLISADLEAGPGMRFTDATFWPPAMAVAATGDPRYAFEMGRVTAIEARAIGVRHVLAPVADVNSNPDNPVINTRSFGEDVETVSRYVEAFVRGVQSEGSLACAKHWPGHGDTHVDSHVTMPTLERMGLEPFRAAIRAGVASVMVGHLAVPSIDPSGLPATLSKPLIDLLRAEFDGLIVSDSFDMGGITRQFGPGEAAVRGIEAGLDQILFAVDTDAAIAAVAAAVRSGRIAESRIDESLERVLAAKRRVRDFDPTAEEIANRVVRVVRDERALLPLRGDVAAVVVSDFPEANPLLDASRTFSRLHTIDATTPALDLDADVIVLLLALRPKSGAGRIALPPAARALAERHAGKTVAVSFGSPYILRDLPPVSTYIDAYGVQPVMQQAALRLLFR